MAVGHRALGGVVGGLFAGHGAQKLFGAFGGHGIDGTAQFFEQVGMRPGKRNAILAGAAETAGGAMLAAGVATPLAASALTATMATAIWKVHRPNGPWVGQNGYEYNLVLMAAVFAITADRKGALAAIGQLAAGLGGAAAAIALAEREAHGPAQQPAAAPEATANGHGALDAEPAASAAA